MTDLAQRSEPKSLIAVRAKDIKADLWPIVGITLGLISTVVWCGFLAWAFTSLMHWLG